MRCTRCGNNMEALTTKFCVPNTDPPILIENVPAYVCDTCGEEVFTRETSDKFAQIRRGDIQNFRIGVVRVFDFINLSKQPDKPISHFDLIYGVERGTGKSSFLIQSPKFQQEAESKRQPQTEGVYVTPGKAT